MLIQKSEISAVPRRALVLLAILTLVWGTNWPLFPIAVREVSVWTFRSIGVSMGGIMLLGFAAARGQSLTIPRRYWRTVVLATFCYLVVWNIASTYAALLLPSGQAAVLGFTMPLWSTLISWAVLGERMSKRTWIAVLLGAVAVVLLMVPSFKAYANAPLGLAWGLGAGVSWAIGTLILKRGNVDVPATVLVGWQLLLTAVPLTIGAFVFGDGKWFMLSWQSILVIGYIAIVPMGIGNLCWFSIVGLLPANIAGLSSIMVPMVAMVTGALAVGEPLGPMQVLAMVCCVVSLGLVLLKPRVAA